MCVNTLNYADPNSVCVIGINFHIQQYNVSISSPLTSLHYAPRLRYAPTQAVRVPNHGAQYIDAHGGQYMEPDVGGDDDGYMDVPAGGGGEESGYMDTAPADDDDMDDV